MDTNSSAWAIPVSRPWGKFAHYYKDGSFKSPDGIYFGNDEDWNYLQKKKVIFDFLKNERPHDPIQPAALKKDHLAKDASQTAIKNSDEPASKTPKKVEKKKTKHNFKIDKPQPPAGLTPASSTPALHNFKPVKALSKPAV